MTAARHAAAGLLLGALLGLAGGAADSAAARSAWAARPSALRGVLHHTRRGGSQNTTQGPNAAATSSSPSAAAGGQSARISASSVRAIGQSVGIASAAVVATFAASSLAGAASGPCTLVVIGQLQVLSQVGKVGSAGGVLAVLSEHFEWSNAELPFSFFPAGNIQEGEQRRSWWDDRVGMMQRKKRPPPQPGETFEMQEARCRSSQSMQEEELPQECQACGMVNGLLLLDQLAVVSIVLLVVFCARSMACLVLVSCLKQGMIDSLAFPQWEGQAVTLLWFGICRAVTRTLTIPCALWLSLAVVALLGLVWCVVLVTRSIVRNIMQRTVEFQVRSDVCAKCTSAGEWKVQGSSRVWCIFLFQHMSGGRAWMYAIWVLVRKLLFAATMSASIGALNAILAVVLHGLDFLILLYMRPYSAWLQLLEVACSVCSLFSMLLAVMPVLLARGDGLDGESGSNEGEPEDLSTTHAAVNDIALICAALSGTFVATSFTLCRLMASVIRAGAGVSEPDTGSECEDSEDESMHSKTSESKSKAELLEEGGGGGKATRPRTLFQRRRFWEQRRWGKEQAVKKEGAPIQRQVRGHTDAEAAAVLIQKHARGMIVRRVGKDHVNAGESSGNTTTQDAAAVVIQKHVRGRATRCRVASVQIQAARARAVTLSEDNDEAQPDDFEVFLGITAGRSPSKWNLIAATSAPHQDGTATDNSGVEIHIRHASANLASTDVDGQGSECRDEDEMDEESLLIYRRLRAVLGAQRRELPSAVEPAAGLSASMTSTHALNHPSSSLETTRVEEDDEDGEESGAAQQGASSPKTTRVDEKEEDGEERGAARKEAKTQGVRGSTGQEENLETLQRLLAVFGIDEDDTKV